MMTLSEIGNIPVDFAVLKSIFPDHKSVHNKISELEKSGTLIRLKKGMYVLSPKESGKLISVELVANHLYGPSYVSKESALRYYGLIPESVYSVQSMTTKHSRVFVNSLGKFEYTQCEKSYFSVGIRQEIMDNTSFLIACPEKALCDLIIHTPNLNLRFQKDMLAYLKDDLRFDMDAFYRMDSSLFEQCAQMGKKRTVIENMIKIKQR
ncbi:MAG: hypothetical protein PHI48_05710 [Bacteroidales bacterium]|nr:hypothetical protein [Bacteroidales bacterium]MDD4822036.1 hypothetical protein [Bacteroidales bacterium]